MQWVKSTRKRPRLLGSESGSTSGPGNTFQTGLCSPLFTVDGRLFWSLGFKRELRNLKQQHSVTYNREKWSERNIVSSYFEVSTGLFYTRLANHVIRF